MKCDIRFGQARERAKRGEEVQSRISTKKKMFARREGDDDDYIVSIDG